MYNEYLNQVKIINRLKYMNYDDHNDYGVDYDDHSDNYDDEVHNDYHDDYHDDDYYYDD